MDQINQIPPQSGIGLIAAERERQKQALGYTSEGDDRYTMGQLREAAMSHVAICDSRYEDKHILEHFWPWDVTFWKKDDKNIERHLVKAGALLAAEIDRRHRAFKAACNEFAQEALGFEVFDERDDYDLEGLDWIGKDPKEFVREHFEEDFCRAEYERDLQRQSDEEGAYEEGEEAADGEE